MLLSSGSLGNWDRLGTASTPGQEESPLTFSTGHQSSPTELKGGMCLCRALAWWMLECSATTAPQILTGNVVITAPSQCLTTTPGSSQGSHQENEEPGFLMVCGAAESISSGIIDLYTYPRILISYCVSHFVQKICSIYSFYLVHFSFPLKIIFPMSQYATDIVGL